MEPDKAIPHADTDFGNEKVDSTPIASGKFSGINEWIFSLMRPKKKVVASEVSKSQIASAQNNSLIKSYVGESHERIVPTTETIPPMTEVRNGLLLRKKTFIETARDQLKFPQISKASGIIYGMALIIFAVGAYLLYAALPTRADLILGILLVTISANVIVSNR